MTKERGGAAGLTLRGCHIRKQLGQHRRTCVLEPFQSCLARRGPSWKGSYSFASARAVRACPYFCLHLPRCDLVCRRLGERPLASASASHKDAVSQAMSHHYRAAPTWIKTLLLYSRHRMCGGTVEAWGALNWPRGREGDGCRRFCRTEPPRVDCAGCATRGPGEQVLPE